MKVFWLCDDVSLWRFGVEDSMADFFPFLFFYLPCDCPSLSTFLLFCFFYLWVLFLFFAFCLLFHFICFFSLFWLSAKFLLLVYFCLTSDPISEIVLLFILLMIFFLFALCFYWFLFLSFFHFGCLFPIKFDFFSCLNRLDFTFVLKKKKIWVVIQIYSLFLLFILAYFFFCFEAGGEVVLIWFVKKKRKKEMHCFRLMLIFWIDRW